MIADIRTINTLYLAVLLLCLDNKEFTDLSKHLGNFFEGIVKKCKAVPNPLENVSAEVITEVDSIFKKYILTPPNNQIQPPAGGVPL